MSQLFWSLQIKCRFSVIIACDFSMWGLNRVVMIFEIFISLHKSHMTSPVNFEAQCLRIEPGDPKTATTLSTSVLDIVSTSWSRTDMSVRYLNNCSLYERMCLSPFSLKGSGPMQSILIFSKIANGVSVISTAILVFEKVCLFFWHEANFSV